MNDSRRYTEDEVAEILDRATTRTNADNGLPASRRDQGITLAELQEIGSDVGISPDRIAEAALAVVQKAPVTDGGPMYLGVPRSVERTLQIPRGLTDEEWSRVVADVRETFQAQGELESHGSLRSWRNGNLQVHVEPDDDGYRVRMKTIRGDVPGHIALGVVSSLFALMLAIILRTEEIAGAGFIALSLLAGVSGVGGLGVLAGLRVMLPRWASERADQMAGLARRIPLLLKDGE